MILKSALATIFLSTSLFIGDANATQGWTCPNSPINELHRIDGIGYDSRYYQPRIHFAHHPPDLWSYLSADHGVNTDYGKAMLSIALTAYSTGAQVRVRCSSGNNVSGLWISDAGGISPN
ncbi:hypothetical protein [Chania multitudinisentens]|uniref:hypothetical protein n=1 Tax=Chania multitudinisentens TaxID=1639108 RepID=UPI0012B55AF0|nr:hypothetical protein [Chania multitudinisentens]